MKIQKILVVDDETGMQRSLQRVLEARYAVHCAGSARAALELARSERPDLAILDIRMPDGDGFQLLTDLRTVVPDIDGIFMTGAIGELDTQIVRSIRERAFYFITKPFDRDVLLTLVERCLELRRLSEENRAHTQRLERELAAARRFQESLLPPASAVLGPVTVAARYAPCSELGGDLVDYVESHDSASGRVTGLVCDASGHGVSAAMLTGIVKSAFHDTRDEALAPGDVVQRVARALRSFEEDRFVTLFCLRVDPAARRLEYVNAGHPAAVLWNGNAAPRELGLTGPMISPAFPDVGWDVVWVELDGPGRLFAYTDGIVEARCADELYGDERLRAVLAACAPAVGQSGAELLDAVLADVDTFTRGAEPDDDRTLLALDWE